MCLYVCPLAACVFCCHPLGRESVILCSSLLSLVLHRPVRPLGRESVILCSSSPCLRPSSTKHSCLLSFLSYPSARMPYLVLIIHKDERVDVPVFPRPSHPLVPIRLPGRESACSYSSSLLSWPPCHSLFTRSESTECSSSSQSSLPSYHFTCRFK